MIVTWRKLLWIGSLALVLAGCLRSYLFEDCVHFSGVQHEFFSEQGILGYRFRSVPSDYFYPAYMYLIPAPIADVPEGTVAPPPAWTIGGHFGFYFVKNGLGSHFHMVCLPYWFIIALFFPPLLPLARRYITQLRGESRKRAGLCVVCGYDLRASKERCPECGTVITTGAKA